MNLRRQCRRSPRPPRPTNTDHKYLELVDVILPRPNPKSRHIKKEESANSLLTIVKKPPRNAPVHDRYNGTKSSVTSADAQTNRPGQTKVENIYDRPRADHTLLGHQTETVAEPVDPTNECPYPTDRAQRNPNRPYHENSFQQQPPVDSTARQSIAPTPMVEITKAKAKMDKTLRKTQRKRRIASKHQIVPQKTNNNQSENKTHLASTQAPETLVRT